MSLPTTLPHSRFAEQCVVAVSKIGATAQGAIQASIQEALSDRSVRLYALSDDDAATLVAATTIVFQQRLDMHDVPDAYRFQSAYRRIHFLLNEAHFFPISPGWEENQKHKRDIQRLVNEFTG